MKYISTRNPAAAVSGSAAVLSGLAPDGGLYVPESFPSVSMSEIEAMTGLDYPERSARIMSLFFDELTYDELLSITRRAYSTFDGIPRRSSSSTRGFTFSNSGTAGRTRSRIWRCPSFRSS